MAAAIKSFSEDASNCLLYAQKVAMPAKAAMVKKKTKENQRIEKHQRKNDVGKIWGRITEVLMPKLWGNLLKIAETTANMSTEMMATLNITTPTENYQMVESSIALSQYLVQQLQMHNGQLQATKNTYHHYGATLKIREWRRDPIRMCSL